jgi:hypothetical protein
VIKGRKSDDSAVKGLQRVNRLYGGRPIDENLSCLALYFKEIFILVQENRVRQSDVTADHYEHVVEPNS